MHLSTLSLSLSLLIASTLASPVSTTSANTLNALQKRTPYAECSPYFGQPTTWDCYDLVDHLAFGHGSLNTPVTFEWRDGIPQGRRTEPILPHVWRNGKCLVTLLLPTPHRTAVATWNQILDAMYNTISECVYNDGVDDKTRPFDANSPRYPGRMGGWALVGQGPMMVEVSQGTRGTCQVPPPPRGTRPTTENTCDVRMLNPLIWNAFNRLLSLG